jgi:hypothetical protein
MTGTKPTLSFLVAVETRELIGQLSDKSGLRLGQVITLALDYYRGLIDAEQAERPDGPRLGVGQESRQMTVTAAEERTARWLTDVRDRWSTSFGLILMKALDYYVGAIESGKVTLPAKPGPKPEKPKPAPKKTYEAGQPVRPRGAPTLTDRALCGVCHKQVFVDSGTSLLAGHIAHASVRPRGEYKLCDGSGKTPAGPIIHGAEVVTQARRYI